MRDALGDRMKRLYERRTQTELPRRTYTLLRIDGRAFHTYTKGCARPYDSDLMADMDATAQALCGAIDGARFGFVQSDEISLLLTDFDGLGSEAWFDGNIQKIVSVAASLATAHFNAARASRDMDSLACFDARVWTIPEAAEVANYFIWRQQDATRNSISMTARAYFPHRECQGKSTDALQELLFTQAGINWNNLPVGFKRGRAIVKESMEHETTYTDKRTGEIRSTKAIRSFWACVEPPVFTQDRAWLLEKIPTVS
ncbi:MAG: tRNA(His) guanylyltransferase Thg1 family protein [Armatimonas sp.]